METNCWSYKEKFEERLRSMGLEGKSIISYGDGIFEVTLEEDYFNVRFLFKDDIGRDDIQIYTLEELMRC